MWSKQAFICTVMVGGGGGKGGEGGERGETSIVSVKTMSEKCLSSIALIIPTFVIWYAQYQENWRFYICNIHTPLLEVPPHIPLMPPYPINGHRMWFACEFLTVNNFSLSLPPPPSLLLSSIPSLTLLLSLPLLSFPLSLSLSHLSRWLSSLLILSLAALSSLTTSMYSCSSCSYSL